MDFSLVGLKFQYLLRQVAHIMILNRFYLIPFCDTGTELDDWPGGIKQKYSTLLPLLAELMKELNFSSEAMAERRFLPEGKDDAVGLWTVFTYSIILLCDSIEMIYKG